MAVAKQQPQEGVKVTLYYWPESDVGGDITCLIEKVPPETPPKEMYISFDILSKISRNKNAEIVARNYLASHVTEKGRPRKIELPIQWQFYETVKSMIVNKIAPKTWSGFNIITTNNSHIISDALGEIYGPVFKGKWTPSTLVKATEKMQGVKTTAMSDYECAYYMARQTAVHLIAITKKALGDKDPDTANLINTCHDLLQSLAEELNPNIEKKPDYNAIETKLVAFNFTLVKAATTISIRNTAMLLSFNRIKHFFYEHLYLFFINSPLKTAKKLETAIVNCKLAAQNAISKIIPKRADERVKKALHGAPYILYQ